MLTQFFASWSSQGAPGSQQRLLQRHVYQRYEGKPAGLCVSTVNRSCRARSPPALHLQRRSGARMGLRVRTRLYLAPVSVSASYLALHSVPEARNGRPQLPGRGVFCRGLRDGWIDGAGWGFCSQTLPRNICHPKVSGPPGREASAVPPMRRAVHSIRAGCFPSGRHLGGSGSHWTAPAGRRAHASRAFSIHDLPRISRGSCCEPEHGMQWRRRGWTLQISAEGVWIWHLWLRGKETCASPQRRPGFGRRWWAASRHGSAASQQAALVC